MRNLNLNAPLKGQALVAGIVGMIVAVILIFSALLPIMNTQLQSTSANLSGYTSANQIAQTLPLFVVLGVLLLIVGTFLVFRGR